MLNSHENTSSGTLSLSIQRASLPLGSIVVLERMTRYLDSLPRGLDAYPEYLMKAAVLRAGLANLSNEQSARLSVLPPMLASLAQDPPPVSTWVPEVHAYAVFLGVADLFEVTDEDFVRAKLAANRRLLQSPLYRILFLFASPQAMLRQAPVRWQKFHKGIRLRSFDVGASSGKVRLDYPHSLVPPLQARSYTGALQAAIEAAGGAKAEARVLSFSSTSAEFELTWG